MPIVFRMSLVLYLFSCAGAALLLASTAGVACAANGKSHLTPLSALHYDDPAHVSETAKMSREAFEAQRAKLAEGVRKKYAGLFASLVAEEREKLKASQIAWSAFLEKYEKSLGYLLDTKVKVFYGKKYKERITNVYRDNLLALFEQRTMDLARWSKRSFAPLAFSSLADAQRAHDMEEKTRLDAASRVIYVMEERYRKDEFVAQKAWRDFEAAQLAFLKSSSKASDTDLLSEGALMKRRIKDLMLLQEQGLIFFRTEREE